MTEVERSIVNLVREEGLSLKKIADNLNRNYGEILKTSKELEARGELTNKDFKEGKKRKRLKFLQEDEEVQRILAYRRDGISYGKISKMPDIEKSKLSIGVIIRECVEFGLITEEEMKKGTNNERAKSEVEEMARKEEIARREEMARRARVEIARSEREKEEAAKEKKKEARAKKEKIKGEGSLEEARKKREKDRRNLQIMQSRIKNDVNLNITLTEDKIARIEEYINASYEFYDKEIMPVAELAFIEKAIKKIPISEEELIRFSRVCVKSQDSFRAFCVLQERNKLDIEIESEENLSKLEQYLKSACKVERAIQMIKSGNAETEAIMYATGLSTDRVNILKIRLSKKPVSFLNFETRERVMEAYMEHKSLSRFYEKRGTTDFEKADLENQVAYRKISPAKRDEMQEIKQDSKARIVALATKLGAKKEVIAKIIQGDNEEVEGNLKKALRGGLIEEDELQGIKILEDPFEEDKEKSK